MPTPSRNRERTKATGAISPCHSPSQNPAPPAPALGFGPAAHADSRSASPTTTSVVTTGRRRRSVIDIVTSPFQQMPGVLAPVHRSIRRTQRVLEPDKGLEDALRAADASMYRSKHSRHLLEG